MNLATTDIGRKYRQDERHIRRAQHIDNKDVGFTGMK